MQYLNSGFQPTKEQGEAFVFNVLCVAKGDVVALDDNAAGMAHHPGDTRPEMLQHDRIALLRHDRADLDEAVIDADCAAFSGGPE